MRQIRILVDEMALLFASKYAPCDSRDLLKRALGSELLYNLAIRDDDASEYFCSSFPEESIGGGVVLYGRSDFIEDNLNSYPGEIIRSCGMVSIGQECDGSRFCFHPATRKVFHVESLSCDDTENSIVSSGDPSWVGINEFLEWLVCSSRDILED